jgi:hypothetical protein
MREGAQQPVLVSAARRDGEDDVPIHCASIARRRRAALTTINGAPRSGNSLNDEFAT